MRQRLQTCGHEVPARNWRDHWLARLAIFGGALAGFVACSGCEADRPPPPRMVFLGLPVSGSLADAQREAFDNCYNSDAIRIRCRRHGVMVDGQGPYEGAVDLDGSNGGSGFNQLTLWHDRDQYAVYRIVDALKLAGWQYCYTGTDMRGDQMILTKKGVPVRASMDLSYWGKRRIRFIPEWNDREQRCAPKI